MKHLTLIGILFAGSLVLLTANTASAGNDPHLADITQFAGTFPPRGWAHCGGQTMQISQNQSLYSLLGTMYGGDGRTTFKLPDLRKLETIEGKANGKVQRTRYIICIQGTFPSRN